VYSLLLVFLEVLAILSIAGNQSSVLSLVMMLLVILDLLLMLRL